jgi:hypothetical protein
MKILKFLTSANEVLYVPLDHLVSVCAAGTREMKDGQYEQSQITLSTGNSWTVIGTPDYIVNKIMDLDDKNDNIQDNKVEEPPINR